MPTATAIPPSRPAASRSGAVPRVAIVLVNWNGWSDCVDCLDSLMGGVVPPGHVYLVDNQSADNSLEHVAAWCAQPTRPAGARAFPGVQRYSARPQPAPLLCRSVAATAGAPPALEPKCHISLIQSGANRGFAGGNNVGIKLGLAEGADWFWLLNCDTVVDHQALSALLRRAGAQPDAGIVGSSLIYHDSPDEVQALCGGAMNPHNFETRHIGIGTQTEQIPSDPAEVESQLAYVVGASMLVSREFVEQVGLMQEDYFLYGEELDWATRGKHLFRQYWAPTSLVYHKVGKSSAKVMPAFSMRLQLRNRLRFVKRFYPTRVGAVRRRYWWDWVRHLLKRRFAAARITLEVLRDNGKNHTGVPH